MYLNSPGYFHYSERLRNRAAASAVRPLQILDQKRCNKKTKMRNKLLTPAIAKDYRYFQNV